MQQLSLQRTSCWTGYLLTEQYVTENFTKRTRVYCTKCKWNGLRGEVWLIRDPIYTYHNCVCPKCRSRLCNPKEDMVDYCGLS